MPSKVASIAIEVPLLTLGAHAQRGFCLSVCVSVKSHLTSGASVRPENAVTYSAGNEGQNICGVFSETAPLQRSSTPSVDGHTYSRPFFLRKAARMRIIVFTTCEAAISSQFLCRAEGGCEFRELPLVMPPSKVCPQCNAVAPIRLKSCQHVFRAKRQIEHTLPARAVKRLRVVLSDSVKSVIKAYKRHVKEHQSQT